MGGMRFPEEATDDVLLRLRRLEGQIRGIQRMISEGENCEAVVTQLAAAKAALDRVSFRLMAAGMRHCVSVDDSDRTADDPGASPAEETGSSLSVADLEKLFLKLS